MSRSVESTGLLALPNGTTALVVCPAGKKIEVLESNWYGTAVAAGPCVYDIDFDGTNALVASVMAAPAAGLFVGKTDYSNHRIDAGDSWYVTVANTTGGVVGRLTYVLVDL